MPGGAATRFAGRSMGLGTEQVRVSGASPPRPEEGVVWGPGTVDTEQSPSATRERGLGGALPATIWVPPLSVTDIRASHAVRPTGATCLPAGLEAGAANPSFPSL